MLVRLLFQVEHSREKRAGWGSLRGEGQMLRVSARSNNGARSFGGVLSRRFDASRGLSLSLPPFIDQDRNRAVRRDAFSAGRWAAGARSGASRRGRTVPEHGVRVQLRTMGNGSLKLSRRCCLLRGALPRGDVTCLCARTRPVSVAGGMTLASHAAPSSPSDVGWFTDGASL
jgi:hypothetical protein